jgi:copper homeostasis protein
LKEGKSAHEAYLLEVIVCSMDDVFEAERGGADRLEVVRELEVGGLTPSLEFVKRIKEASHLPLRVMLRESEQDLRPSSKTLDDLRAALLELERVGVDGVVMGFLREGEVDLETMKAVLCVAPHVPVTFHHAYDGADSPIEALESLRALPQIDHILTRGGTGDAFERAARLQTYREKASDSFSMLAGGGVDEDVLRVLCAHCSIHEFHVGRAARDATGAVRANLVSRLKQVLEQASVVDGNRRVEQAHRELLTEE